MKDNENKENDVKTHQEDVKSGRVSLTFNVDFLHDFDNVITYFGYSRSSAILEACVRFLKDLQKTKTLIEKGKKGVKA